MAHSLYPYRPDLVEYSKEKRKINFDWLKISIKRHINLYTLHLHKESGIIWPKYNYWEKKYL